MSQAVISKYQANLEKHTQAYTHAQEKIDDILRYELDLKVEVTTPHLVAKWLDDIKGQKENFLIDYAAQLGISVYSLNSLKRLAPIIEKISISDNFSTQNLSEAASPELKIYSPNSIGNIPLENRIALIDAVDILVKKTQACESNILKMLKCKKATFNEHRRTCAEERTTGIFDVKDKNLRAARMKFAIEDLQQRSGKTFAQLIEKLTTKAPVQETPHIENRSIEKRAARNIIEAFEFDDDSLEEPVLNRDFHFSTQAAAGSTEKIEMLALRALLHHPLWHTDDNPQVLTRVPSVKVESA